MRVAHTLKDSPTAKAQSSLSLSNDSILHTFDCAGHEATPRTVFMLRRMIVIVLTKPPASVRCFTSLA